jgi:RNA polymerase sigma factor (sigma-70 family)
LTATADLLDAAAGGDGVAWEAIVDRFSGLVWATARAHRLSQADAADVAQTTWLRLVEHLDSIREPEALGGWLATTARREALRLIRSGARERATDEPDVFDEPSADAIDLRLLNRERDGALWRGFARLSDRCKELLRLLVSDDEPSYGEISAALGLPIGSIGPARMRCLERLRRTAELIELEG